MPRPKLLLELGGAFLLAHAAWTQPPSPNPQFEVASVRRSQANGAKNGPLMRMMGGPGTNDPGHIRYTGVPVLRLLAAAFQAQADQFIGPDWIKTEDSADRFDIIANVPSGATREQLNLMLENLLKDRFALAYHREKRDFDVYELVIAKGGSKLKDAEIPAETPTVPTGVPMRVTAGNDGFPALPPGYPVGEGVSKNGQSFVTLSAMQGFVFAPPSGQRVFGLGPTRFTFRMVTIQQLINLMQRYVESSHIIDRTGLTGKYDVKVMFNIGSPAPGVESADDEPAPDVFSAFEKQLGLKFQKTKAPLDVIVVDHIDRTPGEN